MNIELTQEEAWNLVVRYGKACCTRALNALSDRAIYKKHCDAEDELHRQLYVYFHDTEK